MFCLDAASFLFFSLKYKLLSYRQGTWHFFWIPLVQNCTNNWAFCYWKIERKQSLLYESILTGGSITLGSTGSVGHTGKSLTFSSLHKKVTYQMLRSHSITEQRVFYHPTAMHRDPSHPWGVLERVLSIGCQCTHAVECQTSFHLGLFAKRAWWYIMQGWLQLAVSFFFKKKKRKESLRWKKWSIFTVQKRRTPKRFQKVISWLPSKALQSWLPKD